MIKYVWNVGRDWCRAPLRWVALLLLVVLPLTMPRPAAADTPPFAGVVIQYANGDVREYCVNLGSDGIATGEEALRTAIQPIVVEYGMNGAAVCKIENTGCNFPAQNCFCECADPSGDDCVYWRYFHLTNNAWQYSALGASLYTVSAGGVEGWIWGNGNESEGVTPPVRTFDQICAPLLVTPSPTRTVFISPTATSTPTATATATVTNTPLPTATVTPVTPQPSTITATPTRTLTPLPSGTANPAATNSPVPSVAVPTATQAVVTTAVPNVPDPTAIPAATATSVEIAVTESATAVIIPPTATLNLSPTPSATLGAPVVMINTPTVAGIAMPIATASLPSDSPDSAANEQPLWLYGLFGVIVLGLITVVGVVAYSQRMGR